MSIISSKDSRLFAIVGKRTYMDSTGGRYQANPSLRFYNSEGALLKDFIGTKIALPYWDIKLTSDNKYFLSANYRTATLQDTSGKVVSRFNLQSSYINSIDISSDGNYILIGAEDKTARLWSRDGRLLKVIQTNESFFQVAFIPGEPAFQIVEPNSCKLYNIDGIMMQKIQTSDRLIYSPAGRFLFYIANDGIHRTKLKQPVDSFILSNNHNDIAFNEKMEYNILSVKDLLKSGKPDDLYQAGSYFLDITGKKTDVKEKEYSLKTTEKLFNKGLTFDTLHGAIARRLTELYIMKNQFIKGDLNKEIDKCYKIMTESNNRDDLINAFNFYATITFTGELDSLHISYGYVDKVISLSRKLLEMFPGDQSIRQRVSARCSDLSFTLIDFKQYENSLVAVKLAIKADSTYPYSYSNLPLAYIFNNMFDKASKEYKKWMDKPWTASPEAKTYRQVFIQDIKDLESKGITHPDFAKAKELLKK
jgi:tetratricopeptide (TPR) repeat protein